MTYFVIRTKAATPHPPGEKPPWAPGDQIIVAELGPLQPAHPDLSWTDQLADGWNPDEQDPENA